MSETTSSTRPAMPFWRYTDFTAMMGRTARPTQSVGSGTGSPAALKHGQILSPETTILALRIEGCLPGGFV